MREMSEDGDVTRGSGGRAAAPPASQKARLRSAQDRVAHDVVARIAQALPVEVRPDGFAPLHAPSLGEAEAAAVEACVLSGWVSSSGPALAEFEAALADRCGARRAVGVVSGTAALHLSLLAAGVRPDDEVLLPALTFAATAASVRHAGAEPHFCDVEAERFGLCPEALRARLADCSVRRDGVLRNRATGRTISAVICVHIFGAPARVRALRAVCDEYGLPMIEDAAEALGTIDEGEPVGAQSAIATLSFNGNKIVTGGGGGAVLTNAPEIAERVRHLATTAKHPHAYEYVHDEAGYNYRMPCLNAALASAQLARLDEILARKRRLHLRYRDAFAGFGFGEIVVDPEGVRSNAWLTTLKLSDCALRNPVLEATNAAGFQTRPIWRPLHKLEPYKRCPRGPLAATEDLGERLISLPSGADLCPAVAEAGDQR